MDVNTLLDFTEELLNMYGYETRRNVGVVGGEIVTADIEHELGTLDEKKRLPKRVEKGTVYKADILAEKKDIERPFGRIVVRYKRGHEPVSPSDVKQLQAIVESAQAYSGLMLSVTGYSAEAKELVEKGLGHITIMTPEQIQKLMGKAMTKERWWFNAPAYPITFHFEALLWKIKWHLERMLRINMDCVSFFNKELAYEPYWRMSYYIAPKRKGQKIKKGIFALNAYTGKMDLWRDIRPDWDTTQSKASIPGMWELTNIIESCHMAPRTKIQKPKLPKGWNYVVYRPAMEKHEAKVAAIQWVSYMHDVPPEDVVITGRELIYHPWWKIHYYYTPIIMNAWKDVEWDSFKSSGVYGDIFNAYVHYEKHKRDVIYYYMEKSMLRLFGVNRYVKFMQKVTYGINMLWWNYHLEVRPVYIWTVMALLGAGILYGFLANGLWTLSTLAGIIFTFAILGPLYAFLYVLQDFLKRYPGPEHAHPKLTQKKWEKDKKPIESAEASFAELEELEEAGKLTEKEQEELAKIRKKRTKQLRKKVKRGKKWWKGFRYYGDRKFE